MKKLLRRLRGLRDRRSVAREVDDELTFHVAMEAQANIARGMSPSEARRRALLDLGGVAQTKEAIGDVRALSVEAVWRDVRDAIRAMRRRPGFTALAVATLALGIGVNAAAFAVAYGILGRPLPYGDPSRVVVITLLLPDGGDLGFSPEALRAWLPRLRTVEAAAGYYRRDVTIRSGSLATVIPVAVVTDRFFEVLRTDAESGQALLRADSADLVVSARHVAVLPGSNESIGALVSVSDTGRVVTGIMPADFAFPDDEIGMWLPSQALNPGTASQNAGYSKVVARLKPGVTLDQARADADRVRLELNPKSREAVSVVVLGESVVGGMQALLIAAAAGALLVLLVACANVATLFIGRDVGRQRELAARLAVGARRIHLVRSVVVETLAVALIASVAGLALGAAALTVFVNEASGTIAGLHRVRLDLALAVAIACLTLVVALLCGAAPAWHAARGDFSPFLRPTAASRPRAWRVRRALVVAQIACSCVLLTGAGLLARTVTALTEEDHGFRPEGALEAKIVLSDTMLFEGARREAFVQALLDRVRELPGVRHAGFGTNLPPRAPIITITVRFVSDNRNETRSLKVGSATLGYLRALGARFLAGRDFEDADGQSPGNVVILSESVARFYFATENGADAVGRQLPPRLPAVLRMTPSPRVIGVVQDMKYGGLDSPAGGALYVPWSNRPLGSGYLVIRTESEPQRLGPEIRRLARDLDPAVPVPEVQSLEEVVAQSLANRRMRALPAAAFGALALGVAFVGLLATLTTLVVERRRELAIRSALGATPARLVSTILGLGIGLTAVGVTMGLGLAAAIARALSSFLYGVSPYDPITFTGTALLTGGGAALMTFVAALRARSADPIGALKDD